MGNHKTDLTPRQVIDYYKQCDDDRLRQIMADLDTMFKGKIRYINKITNNDTLDLVLKQTKIQAYLIERNYGLCEEELIRRGKA